MPGSPELLGRDGLLTSMPGFCFFHLVRRFWNHIFTWVSVKLSESARFSRSQTDRYRVVLNLFSRATSCSYVKAVRARLTLPPPLLALLPPPLLLPPLDETIAPPPLFNRFPLFTFPLLGQQPLVPLLLILVASLYWELSLLVPVRLLFIFLPLVIRLMPLASSLVADSRSSGCRSELRSCSPSSKLSSLLSPPTISRVSGKQTLDWKRSEKHKTVI